MAIAQRASWKYWPWLLAPLAVSSAGWMMLPQLLSTRGEGLEGAYFAVWFVGVLSMALSAPLAIIAIDQLRWSPRISRFWYVAALLALCAPGLAFHSVALSASVMELFTGTTLLGHEPGLMQLEYASTFVTLYVIIGLATYPFVQVNRIKTILAASVVGSFLFGFMLVRAFGVIRY